MAKDDAYSKAKREIENVRLSGVTNFLLGGLGLTELPDSLWDLTHLEYLDLSDNLLATCPQALSRLKNLKFLNLARNQLNEVPSSVCHLENLEWLDVSTNLLANVSNLLGNLTTLKTLKLANNKLTTLPNSFEQLVHIDNLDLSSNRFVEMPLGLRRLKSLTDLALHQNQIANLSDFIAVFTELRIITLADNPLEAVSESVGYLTNLEAVTLGGTKIENLPESFCRLINLQFLTLDNTPLQSIPAWIGKLKSLRGLTIAKGRSLILRWESKQRYWLHNRQDAGLPSIDRLPSSIRNLVHLRELYLHGNSLLDLPLEILGPNWDEANGNSKQRVVTEPAVILNYYFHARSGSRPLNEAKLIIVGRGGVGKTSLIKRLAAGTFDEHEPETLGIEIQPWEVTISDGDKVRLHIWDFGGQEILHSTHQFFLTERTIYLLVLSGREGGATDDAEYWLQLIRSFAADSPVIVALNKQQDHSFDINRGLLLEKEKYQPITAFIKTDCKFRSDGSIATAGEFSMGIDEVRQAILVSTENLSHRKVDFPADWFAIKERVSGMDENFLTWDQYQDICRTYGERNIKSQRDLAEYLHILGIALNYSEDPRLRDTHVLNPRWVTEGIYSILRSGQRANIGREGVIKVGDLTQVLDGINYPSHTHDFLLALMEKFHLCFQLPNKEKCYLVPELLGENQPADIEPMLLEESGLRFRYQYDVLPAGVIPRFIVQTHILSESNPQWRWRSGVVLNYELCQAVVRADMRERRVDIFVTGFTHKRQHLLAIIRQKFDEQHHDLRGLVVDQRVPIPHELNVTVSYEFLNRLVAEGELWCRPDGARRKHLVSDLLNGVDVTRDWNLQSNTVFSKSIMSKKHVFLSYCHDNFEDVAQLRTDLMRAGERVWWDQDIMPGADWKLAVFEAMRDAYAVILCLSMETSTRHTSGIYPEASDAIEALREYAPGSMFLIPVRLSNCIIPPLAIDGTRRLNSLQYADLFPPIKRAVNLKKLIASLQATPNHP